MRICACLLFVTIGAVGADISDTVLSVAAPDPGRAFERFSTSFFGKAWLSADNAPLRGLVATSLHAPAEMTFSQLARIDAAGGPGGFSVTVVSPTQANNLAQLVDGGTEWTTEVHEGVLHMRRGEHPPVPPIAVGPADLSMVWDLAPLVASATLGERRLTELMAQAVPAGTAEWTFIPEGLATKLHLSATSAGLVPLDRNAFAAVPADALAVQAIGIDGAAWWAANAHWCADMLTAMHVDQSLGQIFSTVDLPQDPAEVFSAFSGTLVMVVRDGTTMPAITLMVPRNPRLDKLLEVGLQALGCPMPDVGTSTPLLFDPPGMNQRDRQQLGMIVGMLGASVGRTQTTWIISSDAFLGGDILAGTAGGWSESAIGKLVLAKVDTQTCSLMASDGQRAFRSMAQYASLFASQLPDRKQSAALVKLVVTLARGAGPGYLVGRREGAGFDVEGRGPGLDLLFPGGNPASIAVIAAIAVPNLLESRTVANESAAASTLKAGIFPSQVQFEAGGYVDEDQDGRGEYGFLSEFSGGVVPGSDKTLQLLQAGDWNAVRNGYHFVVYLPDGAGGAADQRSALGQAGIDDREKYWVAYAWPEKDQGRKIFAITHTGMVYYLPVSKGPAAKPAWNEVFGGGDKGWQDVPVWQPFRR